jgi:hypothetical protein
MVLQSLLSSLNGPGNRAQGKYTKLENEIEASNQQFIDDSNSQQKVSQCCLLLRQNL